MADAPKLLPDDKLRDGYPKINKSIDNANEALKRSVQAESTSSNAVGIANSAVNTAGAAETTANSVQTQLNTIVINNGQSDAEVLQARVDAKGVPFQTIKERIDAEQNKIGIFSDLGSKPKNIVQSILDKGLNVLNYSGVDSTGLSDSTVGIQQAINDAINKKIPLFFPNGNYKVSAAVNDFKILKLLNSVDVYIYGNGGAKISCSSSFVGDLIQFENCNNITISGITFDGGGDGAVNEASGNVGISFTKQSRNIKVTQCVFKGFTDVAIRAITQTPPPDTSGLSIEDITRTNLIISENLFLSNEHCLITKYGGARNIIISNNIVYKGAFGFKLDGETMSSYNPVTWKDFPTLSGNAVISNNVFSELDSVDYKTAWGLGAVVLEENIENVIVSNNIMSDFRNVCGVTINGGQGDRIFRNISIIDNKMTNFNTGYGIAITGGVGRDVEDIVIDGNTFKNFNASTMRIESKKDIRGLYIDNNKFKDVCQSTPFLGIGYFTPSESAIYIVNKTINTYYAQDVTFNNNRFTFFDSSTFKEIAHYLNIEGFKVKKYEDVVVSDCSFVRPYSTTIGTSGFSFANLDKLLIKNSYFESGRTYTKHADILYRRNKFLGHRLSLGAGATIATPVTIEDSEFNSNGNGLNEWAKVENNTQLTIKNVSLQSGLYLTTLTGSTVVDKTQTIIKTSIPVQSATFIGQEYIDTTNKKVYKAVSVGLGSNDWVLLN